MSLIRLSFFQILFSIGRVVLTSNHSQSRPLRVSRAALLDGTRRSLEALRSFTGQLGLSSAFQFPTTNAHESDLAVLLPLSLLQPNFSDLPSILLFFRRYDEEVSALS